jgi:hypothetical protein
MMVIARFPSPLAGHGFGLTIRVSLPDMKRR